MLTTKMSTYEEYAGMELSPALSVGQRCHGYTTNLKRCKKRAECDSLYCNIHAEMFKYEKPKDCVICSEKLAKRCRPTKCGHYMHQECLQEWLKTHDNCPMCRTKLQESKDKATTEEQQFENFMSLSMDMILQNFAVIIEQFEGEVQN